MLRKENVVTIKHAAIFSANNASATGMLQWQIF
jgi:hypothetical protein